VEQARGQGECNYVTVFMNEKNLGLQGAMDAAGKYFAGLLETYMEERKKLAAWGPEVELYVDKLGFWVSGNLAASRPLNHCVCANTNGWLNHSGISRCRDTLEQSTMKSETQGLLSCYLSRDSTVVKSSQELFLPRQIRRLRWELVNGELDTR
jgi:hypothetical protein